MAAMTPEAGKRRTAAMVAATTWRPCVTIRGCRCQRVRSSRHPARLRTGKLTPVLCMALLLAGCASKQPPPLPEPPMPVNGQCGIRQDACILGTPSGTGDTTPPYSWMCLGLRGGTNAPCSVPTARVEADEVFAGQNALEEKVKAAGPLRGTLTIWDATIDHPNCDPVYCHAQLMLTTARDMGIPEENLTLGREQWEHEEEPAVYRDTLVSAVPYSPGWLPGAARRFGQSRWLTVNAAGNSDDGVGRDLWYPEHREWHTPAPHGGGLGRELQGVRHREAHHRKACHAGRFGQRGALRG